MPAPGNRPQDQAHVLARVPEPRLPGSQILTGYKQSLARDSGLLDTDTYSLSLTHKVGSVFDLAVSGIYTTYEKDGVFLPTKDYRAEARLGIRW